MDTSYIISQETSSSPTAETTNNSLSSDDHWSFTDIGGKTRHRPLSRDLSPHVTDEVFNSISHLSAAMLSLLGTTLLIA
eukprot:scaffold10954_cov74-Cyclotella_meneghiniana.AAC.20